MGRKLPVDSRDVGFGSMCQGVRSPLRGIANDPTSVEVGGGLVQRGLDEGGGEPSRRDGG